MKTNTFGKWLASLAVSLAAVSAWAAEAPVAQAPQWAVGDTWVYHYYNEVEGAMESVRTETVVGVKDGAPIYEAKIHMKSGNADSAYQRVTDADGNELSNNGINFGGDGHKLLSFPLSVGKEWDADYTRGDGTATPAIVKTHVKVLAYETVHTDAGDFQAYRIEATGAFQMNLSKMGAMSTQREIMWYAPEAKRLVKYEFTRPSMFREPSVAWHLDLMKMSVSRPNSASDSAQAALPASAP